MSVLIDLQDDRSEKIQYDFSTYPAYIRHAFLSAYPNYAAPPHWHDDIEFITVIDGEMSYNINGETILMTLGEGVFVNTRQMHFGFSETNTECEFICILLHPMILCATPEIEQEFILPVLHNSAIPYIHLKPETDWQEQLILGVNEIYRFHEQPAAVMKIQGVFSMLWSNLYEHMPRQSEAEYPQNNHLSLLKNIMGFIQQYYAENITLQQIAVHGGVCQSKCCMLFKEYLHQTPNTYLILYCLDKAAELLQLTDMTITEIAYHVGFNGASYFTETFHKYYKATPTQYRLEKRKRSGR